MDYKIQFISEAYYLRECGTDLAPPSFLFISVSTIKHNNKVSTPIPYRFMNILPIIYDTKMKA